MPMNGRIARQTPCESNFMCTSPKRPAPHHHHRSAWDDHEARSFAARRGGDDVNKATGSGGLPTGWFNPLRPTETSALAPDLPPQADADHGPVLEHVELVALAALALRIVGVERLVADQARVGDAVLDRIIERIAAHRLQGELAPRPDPADIPAHKHLMAGR